MPNLLIALSVFILTLVIFGKNVTYSEEVEVSEQVCINNGGWKQTTRPFGTYSATINCNNGAIFFRQVIKPK